MDFSSIDTIRSEWPKERLNPDTDLQAWYQALELYQNDDYQSMMRCSVMFGTVLAHFLYGEGLLHGKDVPDALFKALWSSLSAPADGQTFADQAQRTARLVLTIIRENGWQPAHMGGQGLFDQLIMDKGNYMLLGSAIGPSSRPWEGSLKDFFAVPPSKVVVEVPNPDSSSDVVAAMHETMQQAQAGDALSGTHFRGMSLWANGDLESAMLSLAEAAKGGSAQAMKDAGDLSAELGLQTDAQFWYESGARAGNAACMFNVAVVALRVGDLGEAARSYQAAAESGEPDGYAALTQLADERGDEVAEKHWARLGAEAGQTFCLHRHGFFLIVESQGEHTGLRRGRAYVQVAADRGDLDAIVLVCKVSRNLGDTETLQEYLAKARATGNTTLIQELEAEGF